MKTFSLDEANALLPQIEELLDELSSARDQLGNMGAKLESLIQRANGNGGNKAGSEYAMVLQSFNAHLSFFQDIGCELKDLDQGLVDFPAYRDGKLIYLCWKRGEDQVRYWHDLDSGYGGRRPL
ncbi:MAG: DUF2203 domain-containing protein [Chloroflexi bacterium]|nr:DUF2203 domain-containing protein [Chloroflexota bacterium]